MSSTSFVEWWVPSGALESGESERRTWLANHSVGWRAVGGKLAATDRRLLFTPNIIDAKLGGRAWSVPLGEIQSFSTRAPTFHPFNGGMRTRLKVATQDGGEHLFVVSAPDRVAEELRVLVS